jgi:hypothetical protein
MPHQQLQPVVFKRLTVQCLELNGPQDTNDRREVDKSDQEEKRGDEDSHTGDSWQQRHTLRIDSIRRGSCIGKAPPPISAAFKRAAASCAAGLSAPSVVRYFLHWNESIDVSVACWARRFWFGSSA